MPDDEVGPGLSTDGHAHDNLHVSLGSDQSPENWPLDVVYAIKPTVSPFLTDAQRRWLYRKPQAQMEGDLQGIPVIKLPLSRPEIDARVQIRVINDGRHPAHGQRGLFAARDFSAGELIIPYIGYVHSSTTSERNIHDSLECPKNSRDHIRIGTWDDSSYDLNLHRDGDIELAVDAADDGNEARFCNDYRGVPKDISRQQLPKQWDRQSKRSTKSNGFSPNPDVQRQIEPYNLMDNAIPNAEFRDVWLETTAERAELGEAGHAMQKNPGKSAQHQTQNLSNTQQASANRAGPAPDDLHKIADKKQRRQDRRKATGMRGVAVFVLPAGKSGKRRHGILAGQEILVSYGKGFWSHHRPRQSTPSEER